MKKTLILLSIMLVAGLSFGQSSWTNHIRKHTPCITSGEPSGAPNKYWGCVQAFDTTNMKIWLWDGSDWKAGPDSLAVTDLVVETLTVDTITTDAILFADNVLYIGEDPTLTIDGSMLTLDSILKLALRSEPPTTPAEGMIYADTDHKLYYYNGTAWKEIAFEP